MVRTSELKISATGLGYYPVRSQSLMDPANIFLISSVAWVFVVLGDSYDLELHQWNPNGIHIIRQQDFWFVAGMTLL